LPPVSTGGGKGGFFLNGLKPISIDNVRNDGVDINSHRFQPVEEKADFQAAI